MFPGGVSVLAAVLGVEFLVLGTVGVLILILALILVLILILIHGFFLRMISYAVFRNHSISHNSGFILRPEEKTDQQS